MDEVYFFTGRNEVVAKVIFLHLFVILFTGGVSSRENPPCQGEPPPGRETPPAKETPRQGEPFPPAIRSMSGRYASYWNAFLFKYL